MPGSTSAALTTCHFLSQSTIRSRAYIWRQLTTTAIIQQRSFNHSASPTQASHSNNNSNSSNVVSAQFDPPRQISRILTHYCREPQLVMIEGYGILQGQMDQSRLLTKYLNIPFAKVQNRFKQAIAPEPWSGIRDATLYGPMCPQNIQESNTLSTMMLGLPGPGFEYSEQDCLNLNVFAPRGVINQIPVICYIHGGLSQGGTALPKNDATNIVKKSIARGLPVIVVTINYRLLPSAGLLNGPPSKHGDNQTDQDDDMSFNWGLYDQKIALEWVRKHIHNFGGNPNEVTLMGHSSGSSSTGYHMLSTEDIKNQQDNKKRLFKRAIMHSGAPIQAQDTNSNTNITTVGSQCDGSLHCSNGNHQLTTHYEGKDVQQQEKQKAMFTFMSDACLPHMNEQEKQVGWRIVDKWIEFAWGRENGSIGEHTRS
ncbi:hypothetical protein FBU30_009100 [Linnemannia zychae]|nr:hypothetical protein FBU30_009100 [Linnemannia zychae]